MSAALSVQKRLPPSSQSAGWLCISAPALARMAALEILAASKSLEIPHVTQEALNMITDPTLPNAHAFKLWVNTDGLDMMVKSKDAELHRKTALEYAITRQAHYPMLKRLFKVSRDEVNAIREQLKATPPPLKPKSSTDSQMSAIFDYWRELEAEYESQIDRWVLLAIRFPEHTLASLYTACWIEPCLSAKGEL